MLDDNEIMREIAQHYVGKLCRKCLQPAIRKRIEYRPSERVSIPSPPASNTDSKAFVYLYPTKPDQLCYWHHEQSLNREGGKDS